MRIGGRVPEKGTWEKLGRAGIVAAIAYGAAAPYVWYVSRVAYPDTIRSRFPRVTTEQLLQADMLLIAVVVVASALIGAFLSERNGLSGLGDDASVRRAAPVIFGGGLIIGAAIYVAVGRRMAVQVPAQYPTALGWAAVVALKGALFDECVARYGMMTVLAGATRRNWAANLLQAAFFTLLGTRTLSFIGIVPDWDLLSAVSFAAAFVVHLGAGAMYARYGLAAACAFHLMIDLRFVVHALIS